MASKRFGTKRSRARHPIGPQRHAARVTGKISTCQGIRQLVGLEAKGSGDDHWFPQFRAARAMLGWTVRELARRSIVSIATIHAIEDTNVHSSYRQGDLAAIQAALADGGIEFTNGDEPGVKLKAKPTGKGKR